MDRTQARSAVGISIREYLQEDGEETFVWWKDDTKVQRNDPN